MVILGANGVTAIDSIFATVTRVVLDKCICESVSLAVIVVVPLLTAVTRPVELTVAIPVSDELQVNMAI